jgi:hypothetical protein
MQVMLMMWSEGRYDGGSDEDWAAWADYDTATREAGVRVDAGQLHEPDEGRLVRTDLDADGGSAAAAPAPGADGGRHLTGWYLLEVGDLDEAERWARRAPLYGDVELRQVAQF